MIKKLFIGAGIILGLFVVVAFLAPLFIDANKYRPQIEKAVEDNLNADLQLGQLTLSLWGGVNIEVEKLLLSEKGSRGTKPIASFNDFSLKISLVSLLSGRPNITLVVKNPEINVVVGLDGKMNISKMIKPTNTNETQAKLGGKSGAPALPFELSFNIKDGRVTYSDLIKKTKTQIGGINFELGGFALNRPFTFSFDSNLRAKEMKDLTLRGPARFSGTAAIYMSSKGLDHIDLDSEVDLSELIVRYAKLFNKGDKSPLKMAIQLTTTDKDLDIKKGHLQVNDAAVDVTGKVSNFAQPNINLSISSTKFVFEHWQQVLAPLRDFDMKGRASFNIKAEGALSKLSLRGQARLENTSLLAPGLAPRITDLNSTLAFSMDTASLSKTSLKIGSSDLEVDGTVKNFNKPVVVLNVHSHVLDVDSLLPQNQTSESQKQVAQGSASSSSQSFDTEKAAKGPITELKANPVARGLDFTGRLQVGKLHVHKADLSDVKAEMTFKNLVLKLAQASANAFSGTSSFNATIDFRGVDPAYSASGQINGVDINAAVSNQMPATKDSIFGKAFAKFDVAGSGLSKAKVTSALKGKGNFYIDNGSWSALKAMQSIGESLKKIPGAQSALSGINISDKFKACKSDFTIANGHFNIINMLADMEGARTTVTGQGYVDFDMNLALNGKLITPAGGDLPSDIRSSDGRLSVPYELGCKANAPCAKIETTAKLVATAYAKKYGGQAIKKALQDNLPGSPVVKDLLNKLPF